MNPDSRGKASQLKKDELALANLNAPRGKFHTDRRLALQRELVPRETTQQIGFTDSAVPDQNNFEQVVVAAHKWCQWAERPVSAKRAHVL